MDFTGVWGGEGVYRCLGGGGAERDWEREREMFLHYLFHRR